MPTSPSSSDAGPQVYRKPRADVYTMLLVIALLFLIVGTVALWMVMKQYEYQIKGGPPATWHRPAVTAPALEFETSKDAQPLAA